MPTSVDDLLREGRIQARPRRPTTSCGIARDGTLKEGFAEMAAADADVLD